MIQIRSLRHAELDNWFDFTVNTFSNGSPTEEFRNYFVNHYKNDPWSTNDSIFVASDGNKILSTLRVFRRKIYLFGNIFTAGAIGEVCTDPASRGQGLSTMLLNEAIEFMEKNNLFISTLRTGIYSYYERLGWKSVDMKFVKYRLNTLSLDRALDSIYDVAPVNWAKDINLMEAIHNAFAANVDGIFVRKDLDYWENWVRTESGDLPVIVKTKTGMPVAYLFVNDSDKECINVKEFCANPGFEQLFDFAVSKVINLLNCKSALLNTGHAVISQMEVESNELNGCNMVRLNKPIAIKGQIVETTEDLREMILARDGFYFFDTDGY